VKFRRRYQVVVEGVSGQAVAQRSVISEHRSEAEAREAAELERARLEVIHGGGARSWRILVVLDEEILAEVRPEAEGEDLLRARPVSPRPAGSAEAPAAAEAGEEDGAGAEPAEAAGDEGPAEDEAEEEEEPPPEGPVPEWVIRRFEDSIERRGEREEQGPSSGEDAAS
jgi:hypothetical protein